MPAPARISVVIKPTTQLNDDNTNSKSLLSRPKGRVVPRRRGRGRVDETDSEEELVREPRSDSESETATSTVESDSASEFESETEEQLRPRSRESVSSSTRPRATTTSTEDNLNESSFFPRQDNWADIMANQPTDSLPIMQFSELNLQESMAVTQQQQQQRSAVPSPPPSDHEQASKTDSGAQSSTRAGKGPRFSRKPGQTAREAYINRLNNDPAYVPTVGQFWSHDDRLLDKDLRSLSTWWRGKWQGRGRGGRGRGNFANGWSTRGRGAFKNMGSRFDGPETEAAWSHDKFEEVKEAGSNKERSNYTRGGRGFKARHFSRKETDRAHSPDTSSQAPVKSSHSVNDPLQLGDGQRTWFAMKPERVWTKQFDGYLHFDAQLKPLQMQGLGQGVRVKLPKLNPSSMENEAVIIRLPLDTSQMSKQHLQASTSDADVSKSFAVKLPSLKSMGKQKEIVAETVTTISPLHVNEQLPDTSTITPSQEPSSSRFVFEIPQSSQPLNVEATLSPNEVSGLNAQVNGDAPVPEEPVLSTSSQPPQLSAAPPMPVLSPFQPSSSYASPYIYAGHGLPLPPGIAISENGVTYEIATGRAVYLQTPPPPPPHVSLQAPVFNPRPMPISHGHHNSMSFVNPMPLSVSPSGFLSTPPLFALPRQSSRVEIRAPGDPKNNDGESQRTHSTSQDRLPNSKGTRIFTPNGQGGSFYPEGQPLYTPSTYYYPYAPDGSASFGYGQFSGVDSNQTYDHYSQDLYSQHSYY